MKKLLWTALATLVSAGAAALAMRGLNYVWQRVAHEPPPEQPKWARFIVGSPLKKGIEKSIQPTPA